MPSRRSYHHGDLHAALLERAEFTLREGGAGLSLRELAREITRVISEAQDGSEVIGGDAGGLALFAVRGAYGLAVLAATGNLTVSAAEAQLDDHIRLLLHGTKPR